MVEGGEDIMDKPLLTEAFEKLMKDYEDLPACDSEMRVARIRLPRGGFAYVDISIIMDGNEGNEVNYVT